MRTVRKRRSGERKEQKEDLADLQPDTHDYGDAEALLLQSIPSCRLVCSAASRFLLRIEMDIYVYNYICMYIRCTFILSTSVYTSHNHNTSHQYHHHLNRSHNPAATLQSGTYTSIGYIRPASDPVCAYPLCCVIVGPIEVEVEVEVEVDMI